MMKIAISGRASFDETAGGGGSVEGEVADDVGAFVVFAHLISRGRKEGEENFALGMLVA